MLQETPEKTVPLKALFYECLQKCDLSLQCNLAHVFQPIFLATYGLTLCWLEESTSLIICQPPADRFSQVASKLEIEVFNFFFLWYLVHAFFLHETSEVLIQRLHTGMHRVQNADVLKALSCVMVR